jgi:hypothetical protein
VKIVVPTRGSLEMTRWVTAPIAQRADPVPEQVPGDTPQVRPCRLARGVHAA